MGFARSYHDPCVYTKLGVRNIPPLYVDDGTWRTTKRGPRSMS